MFKRFMSTAGPVQAKIAQKLQSALAPVAHLEIENDSYRHAGIAVAGSVLLHLNPFSGGAGKESHFNVFVVSDKFEGLPPLERHRLVNTVLGDELKNEIHALSIKAKATSQWKKELDSMNKTPNCMGRERKPH
jgi:stress-induced morphogen